MTLQEDISTAAIMADGWLSRFLPREELLISCLIGQCEADYCENDNCGDQGEIFDSFEEKVRGIAPTVEKAEDESISSYRLSKEVRMTKEARDLMDSIVDSYTEWGSERSYGNLLIGIMLGYRLGKLKYRLSDDASAFRKTREEE